MEYSTLGRSGTKVSRAGLGTWTTFGDSVDDRTAHQMVRRAVDLGCNFFDTADSYAAGRAEEALGRALVEHPRDDLVLSTKVFLPRRDSALNQINHRLSRKNILRSLETSLRALKTDYVDVLLLHRYDQDQDLEEIADALSILIQSGKILYWGVSKWPPAALERLDGLMPKPRRAVVFQGLHNLLHRDDLDLVASYLATAGPSFHGYSPLARGALTTKYIETIPENSRLASREHGGTVYDAAEANLPFLRRLRHLAEQAGLSPAQVAIGYCLLSGCDAILLGASSSSQLEENLVALNRLFEADGRAVLTQVLAEVRHAVKS